NFRANWILRSPCEVVICPNVVPNNMFGAFKIGWLNRLMNSERNSSALVSVKAKLLCKLRSTCLRVGPLTLPLRQSPNAPTPGTPKDDGSTHWMPVFCPLVRWVFG